CRLARTRLCLSARLRLRNSASIRRYSIKHALRNAVGTANIRIDFGERILTIRIELAICFTSPGTPKLLLMLPEDISSSISSRLSCYEAIHNGDLPLATISHLSYVILYVL